MSLKEGNLTLDTRFMASRSSYDEASTIMVGVPMDSTCSFRPGARFGPQRIRQVSVGLEEYSAYLDRDLANSRFFDAGDLDIPHGDVKESLNIIAKAAEEILDDGKFPLFIGGEHLISVPLIKSVYNKYGRDLVVLHFDAHADLRDSYTGLSDSHACAIRRVTDFIPDGNIMQFGIRSGTREEFEFAQEHTVMNRFSVLEPLKKSLCRIGTKPVYVTLDIDVIDPAFANGTGTPEPGGVTSAEILDAIILLADLKLVGFDLVEVSPPYDISDRTALLAAKIIREVILMTSW